MTGDRSPLLLGGAFGSHAKAPSLTIENVINCLERCQTTPQSILEKFKTSGQPFAITDLTDALRGADEASSQHSSLEKIINRNNLTDIAWLSRGLELKRSICRVVTPTGLGTGFLVNGDYLITNNHVLEDRAVTEESTVEFNYELGWDGNQQPVLSFKLDTSRFKTSKELDYTVVRVSGNPSHSFGSIDLRIRSVPTKDDYVTIIQHPNGGHKKIALTDNQIFAVFSHLVQYVTDTEPGSSGSPVFDQRWRIVALHHAGGNLPGPTGRPAFVNEGISIDAIIRDASEVLGVSDEIFEAVTTTIRPDLEWLCTTSGTKSDIQNVATMIAVHGGSFPKALQNRVESGLELGPLGAVILGTAAGAVIRHIGRQNEGASVESATIGLDESAIRALKRDIGGFHGTNITPWDVFSGAVINATKNSAEYDSLFRYATDLEAFPVVVGAFLAGVIAGAKAYDGKF